MISSDQLESAESRKQAGGGVDRARTDRLVRIATYASLTAAAALIVSKGVAWSLTDSISLLSSLVDSLLDALASILTFITVRQALTPADHEHRFGHGKAESLGALGQSAFVTGSAALLMVEAVNRLLNPQPITEGAIGIGVMVFSIVVTLALVTFQRFVVRQSGSVAISADLLHYAGDLLANLAVIVAIILTFWLDWRIADPLFGIAIGAFILWNAWQILRTALNDLMDRELPEEDRQAIADIALQDRRVLAVHDLRTRSAGRDAFIQMHLEMDASLPFGVAHEIADAAEIRIANAYPNAEVIVHQDPVLVDPDALEGRFTR